MAERIPSAEDDRIDWALRNLLGCYRKLDDAATEFPGMSYERAVWDSRDVMKHYLRELFDALGRNTPEELTRS